MAITSYVYILQENKRTHRQDNDWKCTKACSLDTENLFLILMVFKSLLNILQFDTYFFVILVNLDNNVQFNWLPKIMNDIISKR